MAGAPQCAIMPVFAATCKAEGLGELSLFSANAFYYWTVIHVTISFAPGA